MSLNGDHFVKLLIEIQQDISTSPIKNVVQRYNRIAGIIKRRIDLLSNDRVIKELCNTREKLFNMQYLGTISITLGLLISLFLLLLGALSLYFSQFPGLIGLIFDFPPKIEYITDKIFITSFSIYTILAGSFNPLKYIIGRICSINFNGFYLGNLGQLALKKDCISYFRAGKKRLIFYFFSALIPFLVLLVVSLWLYFVASNLSGFFIILFHLMMTYVFYKKRKGETYRFIREIKTFRQQKYLSDLLKLKYNKE